MELQVDICVPKPYLEENLFFYLLKQYQTLPVWNPGKEGELSCPMDFWLAEVYVCGYMLTKA